jgi:DnaK suppressor protein
MTTPADARPYAGEREFDVPRDLLEAQFQEQTDRLIRLTSRYRYSQDEALAALIGSTRLSLADTAHALRRIAEGRYGTCEHCGAGIPRWLLLDQPQASLCPRCTHLRSLAAQILDPSGGRSAGGCGDPPSPAASGHGNPSV